MATTNFVDGSTVSAASWFDDADTAVYSYLTSVSGTNTITAAGPAGMTAYAAGQHFRFIPAATNTGAATINITPSGGSSLGAKDIYSAGAALVGRELKINVPVMIIYDGTRFHVIGSLGTEESGSFTAACTGPFNSTNVTIYYSRIGNQITLMSEGARPSGNNNAAPITINLNSMPATIRPATLMILPCASVTNNGSDAADPGQLSLPTAGDATMNLSGATANFTATNGTVGFYAFSISYIKTS